MGSHRRVDQVWMYISEDLSAWMKNEEAQSIGWCLKGIAFKSCTLILKDPSNGSRI
jgi:hypothetical protein